MEPATIENGQFRTTGRITGNRFDSDTDGADRSFGQLASDLSRHAQDLVRGEVELAKAEMVEEAKKFGRGAALAGAGAVVGLVTLGLVAVTIALVLDLTLDTWLAFLVTTVLFAGVAAALVAVGIRELREVKPVPEQAIEHTKEDVSWVKTHV